MRLDQDRQMARATLELGKALKLQAEANLTPKGLLSIGVLVSGILLSTSVLVATAIRHGRKARESEPAERLTGQSE